MVLTYLGGWILHWRTLAWISNAFLIVPCITCMFIHESPSWLIWKGKLEAAKKALDWMHKYQPNPENCVSLNIFQKLITNNMFYISERNVCRTTI